MTTISTDIRISFPHEGTTLDVPRSLLTMHSETFRDIFSSPLTLDSSSDQIDLGLIGKETFEHLINILKRTEEINRANAEAVYQAADQYGFSDLCARIKIYAQSLPLDELETYVTAESSSQLWSEAIKTIVKTKAWSFTVSKIQSVANIQLKNFYSQILFENLIESDELSTPLTFSPVEKILLKCSEREMSPHKHFSRLERVENQQSVYQAIVYMINEQIDFSLFLEKARAVLTAQQYHLLWELILVESERKVQNIVYLTHHAHSTSLPLLRDIQIGKTFIQELSKTERYLNQIQAVAKAHGKSEFAEALTKLLKHYPITLSGSSSDFVPRQYRYSRTLINTSFSDYKKTCAITMIESATRICFLAGLIFCGGTLFKLNPTREALFGFSACWLLMSPATLLMVSGLTAGLSVLALVIYQFGTETLRIASRGEDLGPIFLVGGFLTLGYYVSVMKASACLESWGLGTILTKKIANRLAPRVVKFIERRT